MRKRKINIHIFKSSAYVNVKEKFRIAMNVFHPRPHKIKKNDQ